MNSVGWVLLGFLLGWVWSLYLIKTVRRFRERKSPDTVFADIAIDAYTRRAEIDISGPLDKVADDLNRIVRIARPDKEPLTRGTARIFHRAFWILRADPKYLEEVGTIMNAMLSHTIRHKDADEALGEIIFEIRQESQGL